MYPMYPAPKLFIWEISTKKKERKENKQTDTNTGLK